MCPHMERSFASYVANNTRTVFKDGREYIVAPLSMLVPGVLPGSKGPLLYPAEEVAKNPESWNGMPLVVYHPTILGQPVTANHPGVLAKSGIGVVRNARITKTGRLAGQGWFDVELCDKVDKRVLMSLRQGSPIELSTGLFTTNEERSGRHHDGRIFTRIARDYRPDHLAILPDQQGACSLKDGCGVNITANNNGGFLDIEEPTVNDWKKWNLAHRGLKRLGLGSKRARAKLVSKVKKGVKTARKVVGKAILGKGGKKRSTSPKAPIQRPTAVKTKPTKPTSKSTTPAQKPQASQAKGNPSLSQKQSFKLPAKAKPAQQRAKSPVMQALQHAHDTAKGHAQSKAVLRGIAQKGIDKHLAHAKKATGAAKQGHIDKAKALATLYSKVRATQHETTALAFQRAGDHKAAAKYTARAMFHHAHVKHLNSKKPTTNARYLATGERTFLINQGFNVCECKDPTNNDWTKWNLSHRGDKGRIAGIGARKKANEASAMANQVKAKSWTKINVRPTHKAGALSKFASQRGSRAKTSAEHRSAALAHQTAGLHHEEAAAHYNKIGQRKLALKHESIASDHKEASLKHVKHAKMVNNQNSRGNVQRVNNPPLKGSLMTKLERKKAINQLVANCDCDFTDEEMLEINSLSDSVLEGLILNGEEPDGDEPPMTKKSKKGKDCSGMTNNNDDKGDKSTPTNNEQKMMTTDEWLAIAPPEVRQVFVTNHNELVRRKAEVIKVLVANCKDEEKKKRLVANYDKMDLEQLKDIADSLPSAGRTQPELHSTQMYFGDAPLNNMSQQRPKYDAEERKKTATEMSPPVFNWKQISEENAGVTNRQN